MNAVYAQLDVDVGPQNVADTAHSLGITSPLDGIPAEGIGGLRIGVSPLEMADAYATFAAGGIHHDATAIARVVFPHGKVDEPDQPEGERVISEGVAYEVTRILKTVLISGTAGGTRPAELPLRRQDRAPPTSISDAWFVGYNTKLSTAVWSGYPDARTTMGSGAFGGTYSAPTWHNFMSQATPSATTSRCPITCRRSRPSTATTRSRRSRRPMARLRARPPPPRTARPRPTTSRARMTPMRRGSSRRAAAATTAVATTASNPGAGGGPTGGGVGPGG